LSGWINTYIYVEQKPALLIDPMGLWGVDIKKVAGIGISGAIGRGLFGVSGGGGIEIRQCCMDNKAYNEMYAVLRVGVGVGKSMTFSASGKGNVPVPVITPKPGLPACMKLDYEVGKPFDSVNVKAGPITVRGTFSGSIHMGFSPGGTGGSVSVNIIDRRWLIMREEAYDLPCGCGG
jgi:hypothetical protein